MGYGERTAWIGLVTSAISITVYIAIVAPQLGSRPVGEIDWAVPMLWTVGAGIVVTLLAGVVWGTVERMRHSDDRPVEDIRDRDISQLGSRVGQAFLVIGILAALVLCAITADWFWIANALYLGCAVSALVDVVARVIVYRAGMP